MMPWSPGARSRAPAGAVPISRAVSSATADWCCRAPIDTQSRSGCRHLHHLPTLSGVRGGAGVFSIAAVGRVHMTVQGLEP